MFLPPQGKFFDEGQSFFALGRWGQRKREGKESALRVSFAVLANFSGFHGYRTSKA